MSTFTSGLVLLLIKDGKLKALGVIQEQRTKIAPEVPTNDLVGRAYAEIGFETNPKSTADAALIMQNGGSAWAPIIRSLNIKLD